MIQTEVAYLDGEFDIIEDVPSTIAELVELYGEENVVESCVADIRYRNKYPRVYKAVAKEIEDGGFTRNIVKEDKRADGTVKNTYESDNNFLRRFLAADEANREILGEAFKSVAQTQPLYLKGERAAGQGKISAQALEAANGVFAKGTQDKVADHVEATVPGYKVARTADGNVTPESIARAITALQKHMAKNVLAGI
jgi:hypothetical protein